MTNAVSLTSPESLAFHLETRFSQLNVACELELWQEAFRSIEDLHALMSMAKKPPKPQLLANYYDKLARVFLVSENYTLHAYAWYKYYTLSKNQNKALSAEDLKQYVLLSACIFLINAMSTSTRQDADPRFPFFFMISGWLRLWWWPLCAFPWRPVR